MLRLASVSDSKGADALPETHPSYVYAICQGAGLVREGRPIRGNFYCYKLKRVHAAKVRDLFRTVGPTRIGTLDYLTEHEILWSQSIDEYGKESGVGL